MPNGEEWFYAMAKALKTRDHAAKMIVRWQEQQAAAEQEIATLQAQHGAETVQVQVQE